MLRENYKIGSALDAAPYNIRYCSRVFQLDLDGNCFFLTFITLTLMFISGTDVTWVNIVMIAVLVFFLSLGAPNQPGSALIGIMIILFYMDAQSQIPLAILCEAAFGGLLNLTNIVGDVITTMEVNHVKKKS